MFDGASAEKVHRIFFSTALSSPRGGTHSFRKWEAIDDVSRFANELLIEPVMHHLETWAFFHKPLFIVNFSVYGSRSVDRSDTPQKRAGNSMCLAAAERCLGILRFLEFIVQVISHDLPPLRQEHFEHGW